MSGRVVLTREPPVATLVVDNPAKRNCFDLAMAGELAAAARQIDADREIGAVILRGAGEQAFSAGADFDAMTIGGRIAELFAAMELALSGAFAALEAIPVPVIAAIRGACFGGGVHLALSADIRIGSDESRYRIPAAEIGIVYPIDAIEKIARLAGTGAASLLLMGAEPFDAREAKSRRLIDEIVPAAELDQRAQELAVKIASFPRPTLCAYKRIIRGIAIGSASVELLAAQAEAHAGGALIEKLEEIAKRRAKQ